MTQTVNDAPVLGRTRWRRFGIAAGAGLGALGIVGYLAASGALALSFAFSGIPFTLSASQLDGNNFVQYAFPDKVAHTDADKLGGAASALVGQAGIVNAKAPGDGNTYVADTVSQFGRASIAGLSQQICAPVGFSNLRVTIAGSGPGKTEASNLVIQAPALTADSASFSNIIIGESVHDALIGQGFGANNEFTDPYHALNGTAVGASFAQGADAVTLKNIKQIGIGTEAGSFAISGLKLYAEFTDQC